MEDNEDSFLYGNTTHENITSSDQQIASQIQTEPTYFQFIIINLMHLVNITLMIRK